MVLEVRTTSAKLLKKLAAMERQEAEAKPKPLTVGEALTRRDSEFMASLYEGAATAIEASAPSYN